MKQLISTLTIGDKESRINDSAVLLGAKLLISEKSIKDVRLDVQAFLSTNNYHYELYHPTMNIIMHMARSIYHLWNEGYDIGRRTSLPQTEEYAVHVPITMTREAVIDALTDIQIDTFFSMTSAEQEQTFKNGIVGYNDASNDALLAEYNEIVDECNRIDNIEG